MEDEKKLLQKTKNIFSSLKTDPNSVLFSEEKVDTKLLKIFKKSKYAKDSLLLKIIYLVDNKLEHEEKVPTRVDYVEKRERDRSTLYDFDGPFQVIYADIENLEFCGKSATTPRYVLWLLILIPRKYMFILCVRENKFQKKMKQFYDEIKNKRNNKTMRLQVDNEFQQVKLKNLNQENNVEMFTASVRGGKTFAAEQKIRELKTQKHKHKN